MDIGIFGLPKSGKTTLFNALTGQEASTSAYGGAGSEPNMAVVKVPDPRVDRLTEMFESRKRVQATIRFVDLAGVAADVAQRGHGLPEAHLTHLGICDALLAVARAFPAEDGSAADPAAELDSIDLELLLSDLQKVENRLPRLERSLVNAKGPDRERLLAEQSALVKIKARLDAELPIRGLAFEPEEDKAIRGFQFLSQKPLLVVFNVAEDQLAQADGLVGSFQTRWIPGISMGVALCAALEMDIARLDADERTAFLADYGLTEPAADRVIQLSYELLGMISFLTSGPDESRAWTIRRGSLAPVAAGVIHSDIERGFIRAETVSYDDLMAAGSMAEARKRGQIRLEGRTYEVRDGDVINFRFSV